MTELALVDGTVKVRLGLDIFFGAFDFFFSSSLYEDSGSGYCYLVFLWNVLYQRALLVLESADLSI